MVSNKTQIDRFQETTEKYVSIYWELSITVGLDKMATESDWVLDQLKLWKFTAVKIKIYLW